LKSIDVRFEMKCRKRDFRIAYNHENEDNKLGVFG